LWKLKGKVAPAHAMKASKYMDSTVLFQDLEGYGNSYTGLARLYRLIYIADHCPVLRIEALKMAINYVMCTYNVALYQQLHKKLQEAVG